MLLQSITESACFSTDSGKPGKSCMLEVAVIHKGSVKFSIVLPPQHIYLFLSAFT